MRARFSGSLMNELITTDPIEILSSNDCLACGRRLNSSDNFCSHCGRDRSDLIVAPTAHNHHRQQSTAVAPNNLATTLQPITDNRLIVVGMIVFLGPLGLLALWFSRRFSKSTKVLTTVSYVLVAFVLPLAITWYWLNVSLRPLVDMFAK